MFLLCSFFRMCRVWVVLLLRVVLIRLKILKCVLLVIVVCMVVVLIWLFLVSSLSFLIFWVVVSRLFFMCVVISFRVLGLVDRLVWDRCW